MFLRIYDRSKIKKSALQRSNYLGSNLFPFFWLRGLQEIKTYFPTYAYMYLIYGVASIYP